MGAVAAADLAADWTLLCSALCLSSPFFSFLLSSPLLSSSLLFSPLLSSPLLSSPLLSSPLLSSLLSSSLFSSSLFSSSLFSSSLFSSSLFSSSLLVSSPVSRLDETHATKPACSPLPPGNRTQDLENSRRGRWLLPRLRTLRAALGASQRCLLLGLRGGGRKDTERVDESVDYIQYCSKCSTDLGSTRRGGSDRPGPGSRIRKKTE